MIHVPIERRTNGFQDFFWLLPAVRHLETLEVWEDLAELLQHLERRDAGVLLPDARVVEEDRAETVLRGEPSGAHPPVRCGDDDLVTQIKTIVLAPFSGALRTIFKPNMHVTIMVRVLQRIASFVDVPGLCETPE